MTKDIIKLSASLLGLDDVVDYLSSESTEEPSNEIKEKIDDLLTYLNFVLREVTKEYYPLHHAEFLFSNSQCEINYSSFEYTPCSIKDIKDDYDNSVTFNLYPEYVKVGFPSSRYFVEYCYHPNKITSIYDVLFLPLGMEFFTISYGVASEYALSKLLYSEAEMWESKFKQSLRAFKSTKGERRFRARRLK